MRAGCAMRARLQASACPAARPRCLLVSGSATGVSWMMGYFLCRDMLEIGAVGPRARPRDLGQVAVLLSGPTCAWPFPSRDGGGTECGRGGKWVRVVCHGL